MAATHKGHCQACGSLQMLPKGKLSLHGYKVLGGFFAGVCRGAKHLPFEESCDLIEQFIREAKAHLKAIEATQQSLRQPATDTVAWVHHFIGNARRGQSSYQWMQVTVRVETDAEGRNKYFYTAPKPRSAWQGGLDQMAEKQIQDYSYGRLPVSEFITDLNKVRATWMEHEADSLRRYIAWQTKRVAAWKPAPLFPVDAKQTKNDPAAFQPTEPKY